MKITNIQVFNRAYELAEDMAEHGYATLYPVGQGGLPAVLAICHAMPGTFEIIDEPSEADVLVADRTSDAALKWHIKKYPNVSWRGLFDVMYDTLHLPWTIHETNDPVAAVKLLLRDVGEDPTREGLNHTPYRFLRSLHEYTAGYAVDPRDVLKSFTDGAEGYDEMIVVRDIPFYSLCEHHMAPFFGTATICYIPDGKIVGLSKLARLLDVYAKRLQVQERLTQQVAETLWKTLGCKGVGVTITARHLCMEARGVCKQGHETVTSALRGAIYNDPRARSEFLALAK